MKFTDQINHKFKLTANPKRIVSVVPSQTELLYDLGLDERIVGITKFCIHPKIWHSTKDRIGGTKNLNLAKIIALQPDLIIANKEENTKNQIEELQKLYPVYTSDISNLDESLEMIKNIGELTSTKDEASAIIKEIVCQFKKIEPVELNSVLYLIWRDPYMSANENTFIGDMLKRCGFQNVITGNVEYSVITENQLSELNPDLIFLSSEPYPFKEKHIKELQNICSSSKIILVDGEYFSWYGSRLQQATDYFIGLMEKMA